VAALFRERDAWAAYVVDGGRARLRRLRVGHIGTDRAEVLAGLAQGAQVVLYPGDTVRDGERVVARAAQ
jgi:HlyD family secretion protein